MSKNLFANDSDSDQDTGTKFQLNTNKDYAKSYNKFRSKELLKKHQDQNPHAKVSNYEDDSEDSDTSSDDDEVLNPKFDEAFYKTLATIKRKDPSIYTGSNVNYFQEVDVENVNKVSGDKSKKALTIKDYERKILLEKGGIYDEDDDEQRINNRPISPTYVQEQDDLKNEFKKVLNHDSDEEEELGGIFKKRIKTKQEVAEDDANYSKWLTGEVSKITAEKAESLKPLKDYWSNPRLTKDEAFLRDYILNNGYTNHDRNQVPTYDEIIGNNTIDEENDEHIDDDVDVSADEAELEKQAEFEQKFNFRFEEPDTEFIKRYPRTIESSVRQTDTRRKEKRVEVKERKLREKEQKMKELEMINAIRKKEIEEKLAQLRKVSGEEEFPFDDMDLDGDFDPDEYDRKMEKVFNNDYYQIDEGEEKPDVPSDIEDLKVDDWDNFDPKELANDNVDDDVHCEDDDFNMDCDYVQPSAEEKRKSLQNEMIENSRDRRKKRKRQSKFIEMLKREKPAFNPDDEKTYGEYLDEYYSLDYEDVIGDVPCRFKYTETVPNDFGLTVDEILMAKNKELNQWASLKKATQIRPEHVERNEVKMFQAKARNEMLKRKIFLSLYEEPSTEEPSEEPEIIIVKPPTKIKPEATVTKLPPINNELVSNNEIVDEKKSEEKVSKKKSKNLATSPNKIPIAPANLDSNKNPTINSSPNKSTKLIAKSNKQIVKKGPIIQKIKLNKPKLAINVKTGKKIETPQKPGKRPSQKPFIKKNNNSPFNAISDERLRAFGINPKKFHKKQKYGNNAANATAAAAPNKSKLTKNKTKLNKSSKPSLSGKQVKEKVVNDKKIKEKLKKFLNLNNNDGKLKK